MSASDPNIPKDILFPLINISFDNWDFNTIPFLRIEGKLCFILRRKTFQKYYLNQTYVDSAGRAYKLTGRLPRSPILNSLHLNFTYEFVLDKQEKPNVELKQLKQLFVTQFKNFNNQNSLEKEGIHEFKKAVEAATTYEELYKQAIL
nr:hypothetical protein [Nonlabens ulvanivorans]